MILTIYFIRTGHLPANRKPKNWFAANVRFRKLPSFDLSGNFHSQKFSFDSIEIQVLKGLRVSFVIQSTQIHPVFFQTIWKNVIFMHHHASKLVKLLKDWGKRGNGNKQKESAAQKQKTIHGVVRSTFHISSHYFHCSFDIHGSHRSTIHIAHRSLQKPIFWVPKSAEASGNFRIQEPHGRLAEHQSTCGENSPEFMVVFSLALA